MKPVRKKEVPLSRARRLINSGNLLLVTSGYAGARNVLTLAWSSPLSNDPPLVGISIAAGHHTTGLIRQSGEFALNVPDSCLMDAVLYCGKHSGRDVDKFQNTGLTPRRANRLEHVPVIAECPGVLECRLVQQVEVGDHIMFVGEVVYALAEEGIFDEVWDTARVALLYHLGGDHFITPGPPV